MNDYIILTNTRPEKVAERVLEYLNKGYSLAGDLQVVAPMDQDGFAVYVQAVVKLGSVKCRAERKS